MHLLLEIDRCKCNCCTHAAATPDLEKMCECQVSATFLVLMENNNSYTFQKDTRKMFFPTSVSRTNLKIYFLMCPNNLQNLVGEMA